MSTSDNVQLSLDQLAIWSIIANTDPANKSDRLLRVAGSIDALNWDSLPWTVDNFIDYLAEKYGFSI